MILPLWRRFGGPRPIPEPVYTPLLWAVGFLAFLLLIPILGLAGGLSHPLAASITFGAVGAVLGLSARMSAAPGTAVLCWLVHNGFVVHHHGELGWDGPADLRRLALFLAAPVLGTAIARVADAYAAYHRVGPIDTATDAAE